MGKVVTTITGDASQLSAEQKRVAESAKAMGDEYKKVDREVDILSASARKAFRDTRTDLEKYNQKLEELGTLLKADKIDQDTYNRAVAKATQEHRLKTSAIDRAGASLTSMVTSGVAGMVSLTAAVAAVKAGLTAVRDEARSVGDEIEKRFYSRGRLLQVASDKADFESLLADSSKLLRTGAAPTAAAADNITFALRSTNQQDDTETFAAIGRTGMVEAVDKLVNVTDAIKSAFGKPEAGTAEQIIAKSMAAATFSSSDLLEIASAAAKTGAVAASAGMSDETVMGSVAVLASALKSAETAGDRMKALFVAAERQGIKATDLFVMLDQIEMKAQSSGKSLIEFLGNAEALQAVNLLRQNQQKVGEAIAVAQEANDPKAFREKLGIAEADTTQAASIAKHAATGSKTIAMEESGIGQLELLRESIRIRHDELMLARGAGGFRRWISRNLRGTEQLMGGVTAEYQHTLRADLEAAQLQGNQKLASAIEALIDVQKQALDLQRELERERRNKLRKPTTPAPE